MKSQPFANITLPSPGFGAMGFSHHRGPANEDESLQTLAKAVELGCTFWDTATVYGYGHNEWIIGKFLKESNTPREKLFISSKCGFMIDFDKRVPTGGVINTREHILETIEGTIERLGSTPDLYYIHRLDPNTPLEESIGALASLRENGKCKYIGLSEVSADTLRKANKVAHIDALQIEYSPWCTDHERNGVLDTARELGITIIAYSPLGRGVLTGKFRDASQFQRPNDNRGSIPKYSAENLPANLRLVDELEKIAERKGCTVGQLSIAWVAAQGAIPIPGTKQASRLIENWNSREVQLNEEDLAAIRSIIDDAAPTGARYGEESLKRVGK